MFYYENIIKVYFFRAYNYKMNKLNNKNKIIPKQMKNKMIIQKNGYCILIYLKNNRIIISLPSIIIKKEIDLQQLVKIV